MYDLKNVIHPVKSVPFSFRLVHLNAAGALQQLGPANYITETNVIKYTKLLCSQTPLLITFNHLLFWKIGGL